MKMVLEYLLTPAGVAGIVGALYLIRKYREYTWGWVRNKYSLKDKIYIITGANSGLGFQTARALAKRGATVVICCRSMHRANQAIEKIQAETSEGRLVSNCKSETFLELSHSMIDPVPGCLAIGFRILRIDSRMCITNKNAFPAI